MTEAEWWDYDNVSELADAVAGDIGFVVEQALDARGESLIVLPGGKTPEPVFKRLARTKLDWKRVTIIPTDERLVAVTDPLSNVAKIAKTFLPLGARVVPIVSEAAADYRAAGRAADARLQDLRWPPDLIWLGMGADGHVASIFPGPDFNEALTASPTLRAIGVQPSPLPAEAPVPRVTLTGAAIAAARAIMIVITGTDKRAVLEKALADRAISTTPIGCVLAAVEQPVDIHWCP